MKIARVFNTVNQPGKPPPWGNMERCEGFPISQLLHRSIYQPESQYSRRKNHEEMEKSTFYSRMSITDWLRDTLNRTGVCLD
jgi:hypothetical protein